MNYITAFKVLNLPVTSSSDEVKRAFRRLAKKWHPDVNSRDTTKKFQRINEAFEIAYKHSIKNKRPHFTPLAKTTVKTTIRPSKNTASYKRKSPSATKTNGDFSNIMGWLIIGFVAFILLLMLIPGIQLIVLILIIYVLTRLL